MLNKKLNPTGPKNKKLVISRHTCECENIKNDFENSKINSYIV